MAFTVKDSTGSELLLKASESDVITLTNTLFYSAKNEKGEDPEEPEIVDLEEARRALTQRSFLIDEN